MSDATITIIDGTEALTEAMAAAAPLVIESNPKVRDSLRTAGELSRTMLTFAADLKSAVERARKSLKSPVSFQYFLAQADLLARQSRSISDAIYLELEEIEAQLADDMKLSEAGGNEAGLELTQADLEGEDEEGGQTQ